MNLPIIKKTLDKGDKYIPADWLKKIYGACDNARDKAYIMYHAETGLRVSDVLKTRLEFIEWNEGRTWTKDIKKDRWRYVYWPDFVKGQLLQWLKFRDALGKKDKLLFPFERRTASRIIQRWAEVVGFPYADQVSSHWLRHTYIRLSRAKGRDLKAVQQNTGDTVNTILEWYSSLDRENLRKEANK